MRIAAAVSSAISLVGIIAPIISTQAFVNPALQSSVIQSVPTSTLLRDVVTEENAEETTTAAVTTESSSAKKQQPIDAAVANGTTSKTKSSYKIISQDRINKAMKERPYPLFLAEKGAILFVDPNPTKSSPPPFNNDTRPREKLVVLGTGWGAAAFLKNIDTNKYDVTVISPRNYFVFTPMLAGASVGTVDFKSITVPIRDINKNVRYLEAAATEIDPKTNSISCISIVCEGNSCETEEFNVNYDKLLFSVGAQTTTFGTPGVEEYCNYLKQVGDAQQIKNSIINCFESANIEVTCKGEYCTIDNDEELKKELTFVIVGAGPTGIEFAAELLDFIEIDGPRYYKELLPYVRIKIVEAAPSILRPFEDGMKDEAIRRLTRTIDIEGIPTIQPLEILTNKQVSEVSAKYIYFKDGEKIEYGMSLWAAGIGPLPLTTSMIETLKDTEQQSAQEYARGRLAVDPWLRVIGGKGNIFALGDCSCPSNTPFLAATAQVASQQGEFLGRLLSNDYCMDAHADEKLLPPVVMDADQTKTLSEQIASFAMGEKEIAAPFQYWDLGILAYTGSGSALAQVQVAPGKGEPMSETWNPVRLQIKGKLGFGLWRSIYLAKQTSPKNIVLVTLDWIKVKLFGRDISIL